MNRKKVLFIAKWYPDKHDNMLGLFIQKHAMAVQLYHHVTVIYITADKTLPPGKIQIDEQTHSGIHEIRIYFGKKTNELLNAFEYGWCYWKALQIAFKKSGSFDIVHVHVLSRTALPAIWLKATKGIPYIITEHWSRYLPVNLSNGSYSGNLRKWFTGVAVRLSSGVTTVTLNLSEAMKNLGLKSTYYITPNIADINDFFPLQNPSNNPTRKFVHVSCFDEGAKNINGIINAIEVLSKERNDFQLEIIGDGKILKL
ncbi:MAG: glycosyltransferase [Bacteroidetes bacterium]|nr:glycosyltransferase [Bacteroidota bacterium]